MKTDDGTILYVAPKIAPTEKSADTLGATLGATIGVQRPSGAAAYGGMDTSGSRPIYSVGGSTGGNTSFSAGVESDGKQNNGVKAGITIKY
ncbi:hypothetical protein [Variovorax sp.]|uniref:hypothetical protein n=1 Tax=Variovorax sp. TaxID=1871043 RepID=UPI0025F60D8F|nr:hypothetical protein [Variovorax sp.]